MPATFTFSFSKIMSRAFLAFHITFYASLFFRFSHVFFVVVVPDYNSLLLILHTWTQCILMVRCASTVHFSLDVLLSNWLLVFGFFENDQSIERARVIWRKSTALWILKCSWLRCESKLNVCVAFCCWCSFYTIYFIQFVEFISFQKRNDNS